MTDVLPPDGSLLHDLDTVDTPLLEDVIADMAAPLIVDRLVEEHKLELEAREAESRGGKHHPAAPDLPVRSPALPSRNPELPSRPPAAADAAAAARSGTPELPIRTSTPEIPIRTSTPESDAPPVKPRRPASVISSTATITAVQHVQPSPATEIDNVEVVEEDLQPPPLPFRRDAENSASTAESLIKRQKDAINKLKTDVHENIRKQVKATKDYVKLFTEPYTPSPVRHPPKSLSIGSMREAGSRFQDAVEPYVDCIEAVIRVAHWENPWRTGLLMVFYFWSWYAGYLHYLVLLSPLIGLGVTYVKSKDMFPGHGEVTRTTPQNAITPLGAATGFASAASDSISAAAKAPASASAWWRAIGDVYGTGREGLGLLEDCSIILEKVKNLLLWKVPEKTIKAALVYGAALAGLYFIPTTWLLNGAELGFGWYFFVVLGLKHHFPAYTEYKARMDSLAIFFQDVPSDRDLERERQEQLEREEAKRLQEEMNSEATLEEKSKGLEKLYETSCIHTNKVAILDSAFGRLYLTPSHLVFFSKFNADDVKIAWSDVTDIRRVRVKSWVVGDGRGIRITSKTNTGAEAEHVFTTFPNRNETYNAIMAQMEVLGILLPGSEPYIDDDDDVDGLNDHDNHLTVDTVETMSVSSRTSCVSSLSDDTDFDDTASTATAHTASGPPRIIVSDPMNHQSAIGLPAYTSYKISVPALNTHVRRRFKEFLKLKEILEGEGVVATHDKKPRRPSITIRGATDDGSGTRETEGDGMLLDLPPKTVFGRFSDDTIEKRRRALEKFLNRLAERGEVWGSDPWKKFLFGK